MNLPPKAQKVRDPLKPCPFCGGVAHTEVSNSGAWFFISCYECECRTGLEPDSSDAKQTWNKRSEHDAILAENERLRALIKKAQYYVCNSTCPTVWKTAEGRKHTKLCIELEEALKEEA